MMKHVTIGAATPEPREILYREPLAMARRLSGTRQLMLLESAMRHEHLGRYSFLACNPSATLTARHGIAYLDGKPQAEAPLEAVSRLLAARHRPGVSGLPPFQGGLAGFIGYEFGRSLEPKARLPAFGDGPDLMLHVYDTVIGVDHLQERAWIVSPSEDEASRLEAMLEQKPRPLGSHAIAGWQSNFTREAYEAAVARTVDYILAGDIFQANISQRFQAAIPEGFDPLSFYARLRSINPAPFACYLDFDGLGVVSSSPERLVRLDGGKVEARPIKGTRRRDADPARDAALVAELSSSRKDRAENVMIVDLLRNDLSRVCRPGSVRVPVLCGLESYAGVHHLTSVVSGELQSGTTSADLLGAVFPGGSITGAPKIRAMEIIAEIEQVPRGIYCGSVGYLGFGGEADFNIAIRTVSFANGLASFQGGGGITARSTPAAEYDETLTKVARIMQAFAP